jgi:hypothetical protein
MKLEKEQLQMVFSHKGNCLKSVWWLLQIHRLLIVVLILNMMSVGCIELLISWINHLKKLLIMTSGESGSEGSSEGSDGNSPNVCDLFLFFLQVTITL